MKEWHDEERNLTLLKATVDSLCNDIVSGISDAEFISRRARARELCEGMFPDKVRLFDEIYGRRFKRLRSQFRIQTD